MKTILKTNLIIIALLLAMGIQAQDKPLTFGVKAGVNLSNFSGDVEDNKAKPGFNVGVTVDYALTSDLYLLSGLEFTTKGAKSEYEETEQGVKVNVTATANPMYLQLPVHLGYKIGISENTKIVLHAGPYLAYGIGGKLKEEAKANVAGVNANVSADTDFFGKEAFKNFDFGLGLGAGVEFGKINAGLGYDLGLANISREDGKLRNMNAYLTVGYKF